MFFISPSRGRLSLGDVFKDMLEAVGKNPTAGYKVIIGSDSQARSDTCFVTAIVLHQVGKGARYYYRKQYRRQIQSLRQKIFYETAMSLDVASRFSTYLEENGNKKLNLEVHLDIGLNGETKELIREIVGMVTGSGFDAKIKPDSCGACKVADKFTK